MEATVLLIDWTFALREKASCVFNSLSLSNRTDIFEILTLTGFAFFVF